MFINVMLANKIAANAEKISLKKNLEPTGATAAPTVNLFGVPFANLTPAETLDEIEKMIAAKKPNYIATANVDFVVRARRDSKFRNALLDANLILCDGVPLVWASRTFGKPLAGRVAGSDLIPQLLKLSDEKNYRVFFLGTTPEANEHAAENTRKQFPKIVVENFSPPFQPFEKMDNEEIARRIRAAQPDILLVAFGSPKAEKWMSANVHALGVPVVIGVGATLDFLAGHVRRAPLWMQRNGLEWIFRLSQEPSRLFIRYMNDLWRFTFVLFAEWWQIKFCRDDKNFETAS